MTTKLIHSMIRVFDLDRSRAFYANAFGMLESHRLEFPTFDLFYLRDPASGFEIELTFNKDQSEPYTHGSGYGHMAFCTENLERLHDKLVGLGLEPGEIKSLSTGKVTAARFFFLSDPDGYKIEVLERAGHYV